MEWIQFCCKSREECQSDKTSKLSKTLAHTIPTTFVINNNNCNNNSYHNSNNNNYLNYKNYNNCYHNYNYASPKSEDNLTPLSNDTQATKTENTYDLNDDILIQPESTVINMVINLILFN